MTTRDPNSIDPDSEVKELKKAEQLAERCLEIIHGQDPTFAVTLIGALCAAIVERAKSKELAAERERDAEAKRARVEEENAGLERVKAAGEAAPEAE